MPINRRKFISAMRSSAFPPVGRRRRLPLVLNSECPD